MSLETVSVLGVKITTSSKKNILEEVGKYLTKNKKQRTKNKNININPLVIFTPNPEIVEFAQKNDWFRQIINSAQINIPDGQGICWAVKKLYRKEISRISGTDLMQDLCRIAKEKSFRIGLIGGEEGVAVKTLECLKRKFSGLRGDVFQIGEVPILSDSSNLDYLDKLSSRVVLWFSQKNISMLFVALGFPKQETFIDRIKQQLLEIKYEKPIVMMGVGGAFDYISGRIPRAPLFLRNKGLEWFYRLINQPKRWKRQFLGLKFFWRVFVSSRSV